jgi:hypothetical protein
MAVKSKTQLAADIAASTFSAPQQVILDDMVDSYEDLAQPLTTVQIAAIATPTSGQLVYNTDLSQFQYYNGAGWKTLGAYEVAKIVVSSAELSDVENTFVDLIAAQGAGLAAVPISYMYKTSFGTTPYDFADPLAICYSSKATSLAIMQVDELNVNASATCSGARSDLRASNSGEIIVANEALQLKGVANPTQGDGTLTLWITYVVIAI